jgi:hypothetical protein
MTFVSVEPFGGPTQNETINFAADLDELLNSGAAAALESSQDQ